MTRNHRWMTQALAMLALAIALPGVSHARTLGLEVWTDRGDDAVYQPGDAMQVKARASDDAYMLVYEIDSNGQISVLYPWRRGSNLVEGRRTYRLPPENSGYELAVEKATGEGYIVALASRRPFRDLPWYLRPFDPQAENIGYEDRHDDEDGFDDEGRVVGDPMVAMERIRRRVLQNASDTDDFATSYATYYVGHEVRYPRYLCADCHRPNRWAWWDGFDPYYTRCSVFDFRVNWNWCWGPCEWTGYMPYYYYVVRPDCPPGYQGWYRDHQRWSSWDGYQAFNQAWGDNLTRNKTAPPPGYVPPTAPAGSKPTWASGGGGGTAPPPGYLPSQGTATRRGGGFRDPGLGRSRPGEGYAPRGGIDRTGPGGTAPRSPRFVPSGRRNEPPVPTPREQSGGRGNDTPREQPRQQPHEQPRQPDPPREQPRQPDPPREQPHQQPRNDPPADRPSREDHGNKRDR